MADFQASAQAPTRAGKPRANRMSTRIDFTPMVDLGFLLITFFMLTTVLNRPSIVPLVMPTDKGLTEPVKQSKVLNILLGAGDKVYWYEGLNIENMDSTTFDANGLRQVILQKKDKVAAQWGLQAYSDPKTGEMQQGSHLNIMIKPAKNSRYKNLVDALDEMAICQVRYYCILEVSEEEATRF
jgi:biopolymer transport protein ExbD